MQRNQHNDQKTTLTGEQAMSVAFNPFRLSEIGQNWSFDISRNLVEIYI